MAIEIRWNKNAQRYVNPQGKFISARRVREVVGAAIAKQESEIQKVGDRLITGEIDIPQWQRQTGELLKDLHIWSGLLGKGGYPQLDAGDRGAIGRRLRDEYEWLRRFGAAVIRDGMSGAQFKARLKLYTEAARGTYEMVKERSHRAIGYRWERRIRTKTESCDPCIGYEAAGWVAIGTLPAPTQRCDCRSNCGCYKEFSRENPQAGRNSFGWSGQELVAAIAG